MKAAFHVLLIAVVCSLIVVQSGCKKDKPDPVPVTDTQIDLLTSGPWVISSVTRGGVDEAANYTGFQLVMTGTHGQTTIGFSTSGRPDPSPWPSSGNFTFDTASPTTKLSRNDTPAIPVTYSVTGTDLTMSFQYDGAGFPARTGVVNGLWVFTFTH